MYRKLHSCCPPQNQTYHLNGLGICMNMWRLCKESVVEMSFSSTSHIIFILLCDHVTRPCTGYLGFLHQGGSVKGKSAHRRTTCVIIAPTRRNTTVLILDQRRGNQLRGPTKRSVSWWTHKHTAADEADNWKGSTPPFLVLLLFRGARLLHKHHLHCRPPQSDSRAWTRLLDFRCSLYNCMRLV